MKFQKKNSLWHNFTDVDKWMEMLRLAIYASHGLQGEIVTVLHSNLFCIFRFKIFCPTKLFLTSFLCCLFFFVPWLQTFQVCITKSGSSLFLWVFVHPYTSEIMSDTSLRLYNYMSMREVNYNINQSNCLKRKWEWYAHYNIYIQLKHPAKLFSQRIQ